jgi:hypothetical protein
MYVYLSVFDVWANGDADWLGFRCGVLSRERRKQRIRSVSFIAMALA